jgi:hypothetical protein
MNLTKFHPRLERSDSNCKLVQIQVNSCESKLQEPKYYTPGQGPAERATAQDARLL